MSVIRRIRTWWWNHFEYGHLPVSTRQFLMEMLLPEFDLRDYRSTIPIQATPDMLECVAKCERLISSYDFSSIDQVAVARAVFLIGSPCDLITRRYRGDPRKVAVCGIVNQSVRDSMEKVWQKSVK